MLVVQADQGFQRHLDICNLCTHREPLSSGIIRNKEAIIIAGSVGAICHTIITRHKIQTVKYPLIDQWKRIDSEYIPTLRSLMRLISIMFILILSLE